MEHDTNTAKHSAMSKYHHHVLMFAAAHKNKLISVAPHAQSVITVGCKPSWRKNYSEHLVISPVLLLHSSPWTGGFSHGDKRAHV